MTRTTMDDITAEYAAQDLAVSEPLRAVAKVTVAAKTDLGRIRENNEDKFEFYISEEESVLATKGQIFLVCDGMGGHAAGQIASELSCKCFIDTYLNHPTLDADSALRESVVAANRLVNLVGVSNPQRRGMGTTLSGLVLRQGEAKVVQVGDSRVYRFRNEVLEQITTDHTYVEELVRLGVLPREQAERHPQKNVLVRAIGAEENVQPDIFTLDLQTGDRFLLCSDGLINHVPDVAIAEALRDMDPAKAAWTLISQALLGGGTDNVTVLIVRVDEVQTFEPSPL